MSNWTRKEKHCDTIISKVKGFKFMGPNDDKLMINQLTLTNELMNMIIYEILYKISNFISIYVKIIQNVIFRNICVTFVILKFIWKKYKRVCCLAVIKSLIQKVIVQAVPHVQSINLSEFEKKRRRVSCD